MSNMSYCRFQNTLSDLRDCADALEEDDEPLSSEEARAAIKLIEECFRIAHTFSTGRIDVPDREELKLGLGDLLPPDRRSLDD